MGFFCRFGICTWTFWWNATIIDEHTKRLYDLVFTPLLTLCSRRWQWVFSNPNLKIGNYHFLAMTMAVILYSLFLIVVGDGEWRTCQQSNLRWLNHFINVNFNLHIKCLMKYPWSILIFYYEFLYYFVTLANWIGFTHIII